MTAEKVIDNKVIILQKNAGYSLEHVVVLWYTEKSEKCKESEFRRDSKNSSKSSFNMSRPEFCKQNSQRKEIIYNGKQTQTARRRHDTQA